jgi:MazG family protein
VKKPVSPSGIAGLTELISVLRGEGGCPWDRRQTPESISVYLIEEMYELVEAIHTGDPAQICEELGDVLFHILFIAQMFQERHAFDIGEVADRITEKMVRRHPHVFGDARADSAEEVKRRWHQIKHEELENRNTPRQSLLDSVPKALPALMRAYRISDRASRAGFEWETTGEVIQKADEEWNEFQTEFSNHRPPRNISMELGDFLFTLVNVARFAGVHPETALNSATEKFLRRFRIMEQQIDRQGRKLSDISRTEWDRLWENAKSQNGAKDPE